MSDLKVRDTPIGDIRPYEGNPREIGDDAVEAVAESIKEFGWQQPIVVDADGTVIAGHTRLLAAKRLGMDTVPVHVAGDLTPEQVAAYRLADNRTGELAEWDSEALALELDGIGEIDMEAFGFDDIEAVVDEEMDPGAIDEAEEPDEVEARTRPGDLWLLGEHRLLCGDSTDPKDVARLMGDDRAPLLFTSPPYADMREYEGGKDLSVGALAGFIAAYGPFCDVLAVNLGIKRDDFEVIPYWDGYIEAARGAGLKLVGWNVWDKGTTTSIGNAKAPFPIQHEFIFVFSRGWFDARRTKPKKAGSVRRGRRACVRRDASGETEEAGTKGDESRRLKKLGSVVHVPNPATENRTGHPAPFPVALAAEYVAACSDKGDVVVEPFSGSGTTICACEQLGRRCIAMELDPGYCDIAIARWEALTGEEAVRIE